MSDNAHIDFKEIPVPPGRTTRSWRILTTTGGVLGIISWYAPWRRYNFSPADKTTFDAGCLHAIAEFLEEQMKEYRDSKP